MERKCSVGHRSVLFCILVCFASKAVLSIFLVWEIFLCPVVDKLSERKLLEQEAARHREHQGFFIVRAWVGSLAHHQRTVLRGHGCGARNARAADLVALGKSMLKRWMWNVTHRCVFGYLVSGGTSLEDAGHWGLSFRFIAGPISCVVLTPDLPGEQTVSCSCCSSRSPHHSFSLSLLAMMESSPSNHMSPDNPLFPHVSSCHSDEKKMINSIDNRVFPKF